jgi:hypothetical protein
MKFVDCFLYITYRFAHNKLKKNESDAKWSAFLHTGVYFAIFLITFICIIGIIVDNPISVFLKRQSFLLWMLLFILSPVLLSLRYYRFSGITSIEQSYLSLKKTQQNIINILIYITMITLPILCFVAYRLYVIGHLQWW